MRGQEGARGKKNHRNQRNGGRVYWAIGPDCVSWEKRRAKGSNARPTETRGPGKIEGCTRCGEKKESGQERKFEKNLD